MEWESFLSYIEHGDVIPVIGSELSLVKEKDGTTVPLNKFIAKELSRLYKADCVEGQDFHELALKYKDKNVFMDVLNIYHKIEAKRFYNDPLEKLARITDFKFYISTCVDDQLVKTIRKTRNYKGNELKIINYSLTDFAEDYTAKEEEPKVTVLNVLGTLIPEMEFSPNEPAINEEELLEHFFSIATKENHSADIEDFIKQIKKKILLFIGCDFPDWFMRFIIRILTGRRFSKKKIHDYIVHDVNNESQKLDNFLEQFNENIIVIENARPGNVLAFVEKLYDEWCEKENRLPEKNEGIVFLSYYNEDKQDALELKILLEENGINVWLDKDNLGAGRHEKLIKDQIMKCKIFLPLLSDKCLDNIGSYMWKTECNTALVRYMYEKDLKKSEKKKFEIIPCISGSIARDDERIPEYFKGFTTLVYSDSGEEKILEEIKKFLTSR